MEKDNEERLLMEQQIEKVLKDSIHYMAESNYDALGYKGITFTENFHSIVEEATADTEYMITTNGTSIISINQTCRRVGKGQIELHTWIDVIGLPEPEDSYKELVCELALAIGLNDIEHNSYSHHIGRVWYLNLK